MFLGILLFCSFKVYTAGNIEENYEDNTMNKTFSTGGPQLIMEFEYNLSTFFDITEIPTTEETLGVLTNLNAERSSDEANCLCDLQNQACNIGCCCDRDCTEENKKIFRQCDEFTETTIDRSSCQFLETNYVNFTVQKWEVENSDLLCVVRRNQLPSYTIQKEESFRSYTEMMFQYGNFWPHEYTQTHTEVNYREPYTQGIPIKYVSDKGTLKIFRLSESYFQDRCHYLSEINYLHDFESQCVQMLYENNEFLKADTYGTILFVAQPERFDEISLKNNLLTCSEPVCLKPALKICNDFFLMDCRDLESAEFILGCHTKNRQHVSCVNIVDSLKFIVFHNGMNGIKNIHLHIHMVNITYEFGQHYGINQKLSVVYKWDSIKTNYSDILSGNPGYLIGRPIIVGTLFNGTILRNLDSFLDNFLVLPQENMGICKIGKHAYQAIEFGYSTVLLCTMNGMRTVSNDSKPTDICKRMQEDIFKYWSIINRNGYLLNKTYGLFGNANNTVREDWGDILFEKQPMEVLENITGRFWNGNKMLSCHGLVVGLTTNIYHAKVHVKELADQEKILAITNQFHSSPIKNFTFHVMNHNVSYEFNLDTRVAFWDITSQKFRIQVDPPFLSIKVPSDFFYPFVKMENSGLVEIPNFFIVVSVCLCDIMFLFLGKAIM